MTTPTFARATRRAQKLKVGITGPSGAGKTIGALALARQLAQGGRVAVIDTENGSAALYGDRYEFDTLALEPPYETTKYLAAIQAAVDDGYEVLVIDSISHQWDGDGGILQRKEAVDARGGNHFSNWQPFTKEHNEFRAFLLHAPIHLIATMRSKMAYSQEEGGKKQVKKVGLQPIQRDGMEYEFTLTFDVQMDHRAAASKDRTGLFVGKLSDLLSSKTGTTLLEWLGSAAAAPVPASESASAPRVELNAGGAGTGTGHSPMHTEKQATLYMNLVKSHVLTEAEKEKALDWLASPRATLEATTQKIDGLMRLLQERKASEHANGAATAAPSLGGGA